MSNNYDNWERLVEAVLKREDLRRTALLDESRESSFNSISSDFSFGSSSNTSVDNKNLDTFKLHHHRVRKMVVSLDLKDVQMKRTFKKAVLRLLKLDVEEAKQGKEAKQVMKALVQLRGIESLAMDMSKRKLTVVGDVDPVEVVGKLRKSWHTEILTIGPAKEPEKKKEDEKKDDGKQKDEKEQIAELAKLYKNCIPYYTQYY